MKLDTAIFYTHSIEAIIPFYRDILGLKVEYQQGNYYVSFIFSNQVRLGIKLATDEREKVGAQTIILMVDDIGLIHDKMKKSNISFYKDIKTESWGTTFSVLDLDGNKVEFLQRPHEY